VVADVVGWYGAEGAPAGGRFHPLAPARILDTRTGLNSGMPPLPGGAAGSINVDTAAMGGVPQNDVAAVVLNLTVTQPNAAGYLAVCPRDAVCPSTSSLNFGPGQTVANLVVAKVNVRGSLTISITGASTQIVGDVLGWYGTEFFDDGSRFNPLTPARILDTRNGTGGASAPVGPGASVPVKVTGADRPLASTLNFPAGQTVPNLAVAKVGADGSVSVYNQAGTTHVLFDVVGWYGEPVP
jgi:hypothetical protein